MFKNNKGVTLMILTVTIIAMCIIFGITIITGDTLIKNTQKNRLKNTMYLIQARASDLLEDYLFDFEDPLDSSIDNDTKKMYLGGEVMKNNSAISDVGFEEKTTKYIYCKWDEDSLKSQGISTDNIENGDYFIIQYNIKDAEVDVASFMGFIDDTEYHKLSDF
jgi:hypothetical protein